MGNLAPRAGARLPRGVVTFSEGRSPKNHIRARKLDDPTLYCGCRATRPASIDRTVLPRAVPRRSRAGRPTFLRWTRPSGLRHPLSRAPYVRKSLTHAASSGPKEGFASPTRPSRELVGHCTMSDPSRLYRAGLRSRDVGLAWRRLSRQCQRCPANRARGAASTVAGVHRVWRPRDEES